MNVTLLRGLWRPRGWHGELGFVLLGALVLWGGDRFGLWWLALVVGALAGILLRGARATAGAAALAALLGWGGDLALQALSVNIGGAAGVLATILGFSASGGAVVLVVTLVFAVMLALGGAWLGAALRHSLTAFGGRPPRISSR